MESKNNLPKNFIGYLQTIFLAERFTKPLVPACTSFVNLGCILALSTYLLANFWIAGIFFSPFLILAAEKAYNKFKATFGLWFFLAKLSLPLGWTALRKKVWRGFSGLHANPKPPSWVLEINSWENGGISSLHDPEGVNLFERYNVQSVNLDIQVGAPPTINLEILVSSNHQLEVVLADDATEVVYTS